MGHKPAEIMDRTCAYRKNKINVLFHIILHNFHGPFICLKIFGIQTISVTRTAKASTRASAGRTSRCVTAGGSACEHTL